MLSRVLSVYGRDSGKKYASTTLEGHGKLLRGGDLHSDLSREVHVRFKDKARLRQQPAQSLQRRRVVRCTEWLSVPYVEGLL